MLNLLLYSIKLCLVHLGIVGFVSSFILYNFYSQWLFNIKISILGKKIYNFLNRKWFFDKVYNEFVTQFCFKFGYSISYKFVDRGIFEILGPTGLSFVSFSIGSSLHKMQTGILYHISATILISISLLFGFRQCSLFMLSMDSYWIDFKLFALGIVLIFFIVNYFRNLR